MKQIFGKEIFTETLPLENSNGWRTGAHALLRRPANKTRRTGENEPRSRAATIMLRLIDIFPGAASETREIGK